MLNWTRPRGPSPRVDNAAPAAALHIRGCESDLAIAAVRCLPMAWIPLASKEVRVDGNRGGSWQHSAAESSTTTDPERRVWRGVCPHGLYWRVARSPGRPIRHAPATSSNTVDQDRSRCEKVARTATSSQSKLLARLVLAAHTPGNRKTETGWPPRFILSRLFASCAGREFGRRTRRK